MRKRIFHPPTQRSEPLPSVKDCLELERLALVEITSEDTAFPIESALLPGTGPGWRAAHSGEQTIRLLFDEPQNLRRISLLFEETEAARTQEFVLRWAVAEGHPWQEIVRQQWNFSPHGSRREVEDYHVHLSDVAMLELQIVPDKSGGPARATLTQMCLA